MKTFQAWPDWLLGSTFLLDPYQTASARPGPPALIQGNTLTASPVWVEASLTCTGGVQADQPLAALAALTKTCRFVKSFAPIFQATYKLRAESIESTENRVSGDPDRLSAMWIKLAGLQPVVTAGGASRKVRFPLTSGVPMLRSRS